MELTYTTYEEMSYNEQLHAEFYDFYKEVHGIRPRWIYDNGGVPAYPESEMEKMLQALAEEAKDVFAEEKRVEEENVAKFEEQVAALCKSMSKDRARSKSKSQSPK